MWATWSASRDVEILKRALPALVRQHRLDVIVANVENAAGGFGITRETAQEVLACGVHAMTTGNHIWDKKEAMAYIASEPRLLRPLNYPSGAPGRGSAIIEIPTGLRLGVINAMGRVHMPLVDDPFALIPLALERLARDTPLVIVDFHAEATSEKLAMGWHLAGRATAVIGTHTHVQTADEQLLAGATAYITDVGMTGPHDSVIGVEKSAALARFLTGLPSRFETATGAVKLHAVIVDADPTTGRATGIERVSLAAEAVDTLDGAIAPA